MLLIGNLDIQHEGAVDPARTVFFGHTTTTKLGDAGEVAFSDDRLPDGRPAWVGLDVGAYNHVAPGLAAVEATTFRCVKQPTLRCDRWFERIDTRRKKGKGKKRAWKGEENLRESEVARSFGLKALASRAKSASTSTLRAQRELEQAGVVFPEQPDAITAGGYRVYRKTQEERLQGASRGPTSFRVYRKRCQPTWHHGSSDRLRAV